MRGKQQQWLQFLLMGVQWAGPHLDIRHQLYLGSGCLMQVPRSTPGVLGNPELWLPFLQHHRFFLVPLGREVHTERNDHGKLESEAPCFHMTPDIQEHLGQSTGSACPYTQRVGTVGLTCCFHIA